MTDSGAARTPRVTIDTSVVPPHKSFVEQIHTPHHGAPHADMSMEDWAQEKHAHISSEVASPHGTVKRPPTPLKPSPGSSPFPPDAAEEIPDANASMLGRPGDVPPARTNDRNSGGDRAERLVFVACAVVAAALVLARL